MKEVDERERKQKMGEGNELIFWKGGRRQVEQRDRRRGKGEGNREERR